MRRVLVLALVLSAACSDGESDSEVTSSAMCAADPAPEGGLYERCSGSLRCDEDRVCVYDSSPLGEFRVDVCEPRCESDDDCAPFGEYSTVCQDTCALRCDEMNDCPVGMICGYENGSTRCAWPKA